MKRFPAMAAGLAAALALTVPASSWAAQVLEVKSSRLQLYSTPGVKVMSLSKQEANQQLPTTIIAVDPKNYLQIEINGRRYWIARRQVVTDEAREGLTVKCRDLAGRSAATRGLGECQ